MTSITHIIISVTLLQWFDGSLSLLPSVPILTMEPEPKTVRVGSSALLHCQAAGTPEPVISWQRHVDPDAPETIQTDSKYQLFSNGSILIRNVELGDEMFYTCVAENIQGSEFKTVSLFVTESDVPLSFTNAPANTTLTEDQSVTWQCATDMDSLITWNKINGFLPNDRIFEPLNGVLQINPVLPEDRGFYSCTGTTDDKTTTHTFYLDVLFAPRIIQHPGTRLELRERENLLLDCVIQGNPQPGIQWVLPNEEIAVVPSQIEDGEVFANGTLLLREIRESMAGKYTCSATNEINSVEANTYVYVMYKPRLIWQPTSTEGVEGSDVKLECEAISYPQHTTQWFKLGMDDPIEPGDDYSVTPEGSLIINNMQSVHQGTYTCIVGNTIGRIEVSADVRFVALPKVQIDRGSIVTGVGQDIVLNCVVTGLPQPTMRWLRYNNQPLVLGHCTHMPGF